MRRSAAAKRETYHDYTAEIWDMAAAAVKEYRENCNRLWGVSQYIYYRPSVGKKWGAVKIAPNAPKGFHLAWNERISPAKSWEMVKCQLVEVMNSLPILPSLR